MKKKKWELAAMTAVTAFLMLGTKAAFRCHKNLGLSGRNF